MQTLRRLSARINSKYTRKNAVCRWSNKKILLSRSSLLFGPADFSMGHPNSGKIYESSTNRVVRTKPYQTCDVCKHVLCHSRMATENRQSTTDFFADREIRNAPIRSIRWLPPSFASKCKIVLLEVLVDIAVLMEWQSAFNVVVLSVCLWRPWIFVAFEFGALRASY